MEEDTSASKKRGRRASQGSTKRSKKSQVTNDTPPLHISFICNESASAPASDAKLFDTPPATSAHEIVRDEPTSHGLAAPVQQPAKTSKTPTHTPRAMVAKSAKQNTTVAVAKSMMLDESDSDDEAAAHIPSMSQISAQHITTLLGAHTTVEEWPRSTEVQCWNCTFAFDTIPIAIPSAYKHGRFMDCNGVFCSFNCAKRYMFQSIRHQATLYERCQLLTLLHKTVVGHTTAIKPAPAFQVLKRFGGYMEIDEYRDNFITLPPTKGSMNGPERIVEIMQTKCIPQFDRVLQTQVNKAAAPIQTTYDRTKPELGSQHLASSMGLYTSHSG